jgi:6-phosphogluconolactonase
MTHRSIPISRRHFIAAAGMTALATKASHASSQRAFAPSFVYAISNNKLTAYATYETPWIPIQTLPSEAPVALVTDRSTHTLHVLHAVSEYHGLPCGYIESLRIDKSNGQLKPLSKQPLSLSGIQPKSMDLSPDGKSLAVAIGGGAAYNILPILKDGRTGRPQAIRKETGLNSVSPSRPGHIAFSRTGDRLLALDQGAATLSVFSAQQDLVLLSRIFLPETSKLLTFASYMGDVDLLFTIDKATGSLLCIEHHPEDARLSVQAQIVRSNFLGPLAIHALSKTLFVIASDGIDIFRIQTETGQFTPIQHLSSVHPLHETEDLLCDPERNVLYLGTKNGIFTFRIDPDRGYLSALTRVAPAAQKIALL